VARPAEEGVPGLRGEERRQLGDSAEVEPAVGEHGQEHRVLPRGSRRGDPQIGLGLREVEDLRAVGEHRGSGVAGIEPSLVHLGDVGDEIALDAAVLSE
jgi:hypothetical protein